MSIIKKGAEQYLILHLLTEFHNIFVLLCMLRHNDAIEKYGTLFNNTEYERPPKGGLLFMSCHFTCEAARNYSIFSTSLFAFSRKLSIRASLTAELIAPWYSRVSCFNSSSVGLACVSYYEVVVIGLITRKCITVYHQQVAAFPSLH